MQETMLERLPSFEDPQVAPTASSIDEKKKKRQKIVETMEKVKKARTYHPTTDQKLDMVYLFYAKNLQTMEQNSKNQSREQKPAKAREFVSNMLGYSDKTVGIAVKEWKANEQLTIGPGSGNYSLKKSRIPEAKKVITGIRKFVRDRRACKQRTVAKDVVQFLIGQGYLSIENGNQNSAVLAVQRYLRKHGFKRGRNRGKFSVHEASKLVESRNLYLDEVLSNRARSNEQRLREVFLDESFIHHHYQRDEKSLYDPNDEQDIQVRTLRKGRRWCFIAAIRGENPNPKHRNKTENDLAGIVPNSFQYFQGSKIVGDYHLAFDGEYFINWFKNHLLPSLHEPSLIIMDNAAYHKAPPAESPRIKLMKKAQLQALLNENHVFFLPSDRRGRLIEIAMLHFKQQLRPAVVIEAEKLGHKVIYTPPYHSDLQPIELLWAELKQKVGANYSMNRTFEEVRIDLLNQVAIVAKKHELLKSYLDHVVKEEQKFLENGSINEDEVASLASDDYESVGSVCNESLSGSDVQLGEYDWSYSESSEDE